MKKLLLIPLLILITPCAKADMDYICSPGNDIDYIEKFIGMKCERNNIVSFRFIDEYFILEIISRWCRHDREINYNVVINLNDTKEYQLVCVLYDNKPRNLIKKVN